MKNPTVNAGNPANSWALIISKQHKTWHLMGTHFKTHEVSVVSIGVGLKYPMVISHGNQVENHDSHMSAGVAKTQEIPGSW